MSYTGCDSWELMRRINALEYPLGKFGYKAQWGSYGTGDGQFKGPYDLSIYGSEVYVTDPYNNRIQVFDLSGNFQRKWSTGGQCLFLDVENDEVYVTFTTGVKVYNLTGTLQRSWGSEGTGDGQLQYARGIKFHNYQVYVVDAGNHRIQVFDTTGTFLRKWGDADEFNSPIAIDVYNTEVYVSDQKTGTNAAMQVYGLYGAFQRSWTLRDLNPFGLMVSANKVYTSGGASCTLSRYDTSGTPLNHYHEYGTGDGELNHPTGLEVYDDLYVCDYDNNRIQVFTMPLREYVQTQWYAYQVDAKEDLDEPDGGVTVPEEDALLKAFGGQGAHMCLDHITDMRAAIQRIVAAQYYKRPVSPYNYYDWTPYSFDNLYLCALGDRTKYGATGGYKFDWTRSAAQMKGTPCYDIDIGEIYECVVTLEAAGT